LGKAGWKDSVGRCVRKVKRSLANAEKGVGASPKEKKNRMKNETLKWVTKPGGRGKKS